MLGLMGWDGATAYELEQACKALELWFGYSRSHLYNTPKRLERLGLVRSVEDPEATRARTRYALTDQGVQALTDWLKSPAPPPVLDEEIFARLTGGGDLVLYVDMAKSLEASRDPTEAKLDALEHLRRSFGRQYTSIPEKLAIELKIELLRAYLRWVPRATKQLSRPGSRPSRTVGPGMVRRRHHSDFLEEAKDLRRSGREDAAQRLLLELLDAMEAEASEHNMTVSAGHYEQLAISYRKTGDTAAEIEVLERYCNLVPGRNTKLAQRLHKLRDRERKRVKRQNREREVPVKTKLAEARARVRAQGLLD